MAGTGSPDLAGTPAFDTAAVCSKISAQVEGCAPGFSSACPGLFSNAIARGCGAYLSGLGSFVASNASAYSCMDIPFLGTQPTLSASAPENAQVGDACAGAVNRISCYAISCATSLDCAGGSGCNDATGHCFEKDATCLGLPCQTSLDCPSGETCNDALKVCSKG